MTLSGTDLLPPVVSTQQALNLYKKATQIKSIIGQLNAELAHSKADLSFFQILILRESLQSTRIEGTQVTFTDMIDQATSHDKTREVIEVDNYYRALSQGVQRLREDQPISTRLLRELHYTLMQDGARGTTASAGEFRKIQNFIGKTNRIEDAVYIPIPANQIGEYMTNLEYYINGEKHRSYEHVHIGENEALLDETTDPLIKMAIIHAQFESIHPFLDGNGRMGRILIVLSSMMDRIIDYPVFFISEELEKERIKYYNRLNAVRGDHPDWYAWILFFLEASERMARSMLHKLETVEYLANAGLKQIHNANEEKVWLETISLAFFTAKAMSEATGLSIQTTRKYLDNLAQKGLIEKDQAAKRNILYVNYEALRAISD